MLDTKNILTYRGLVGKIQPLASHPSVAWDCEHLHVISSTSCRHSNNPWSIKSIKAFLCFSSWPKCINRRGRSGGETEKPLYLAVLQLNKYTQTITKCLGLVGLPLTASQSKVRAAVKAWRVAALWPVKGL